MVLYPSDGRGEVRGKECMKETIRITTNLEGRSYRRDLWIGEEIASWFWVIDYQMKIGAACVRMAGIGGVQTKPEYRMRGLMRALMQDTLDYVVQEGYDVSLLFGIEDFYTKFDYAPCFARHRIAVATRDAEDARGRARDVTVRPIGEGDWDNVLALYHESNRARTCSLLRPKEFCRQFRVGSWWRRKASGFLMEDADGRFAGYAAFDEFPTETSIIEAETVAPELFPTLLYEFAKQAIEKRCERIVVHMPPDHPFAEFLRRFGCEVTGEFPRSGAAMLRIINQDTTLDKLAGEFERRIAASKLEGYSGAVDIRTELGSTTLVFDGGALALRHGATSERFLELPQAKLCQLLAGYRPVRDMLNDDEVKTGGDILPVLEALFPQGYAWTWATDYF